MLQRLGVEGMSSDESESEDLMNQRPQTRRRAPLFYVRRPVWRNPAISEWLQIFDTLHIIMRRMLSPKSRGAYPRKRIHNPDGPFSTSKRFVCQLPTNAYNEAWLADQTRLDGAIIVRPMMQGYDFNHDTQIFQ